MTEGVLSSEWVFNITPKIERVVQPEQCAVLVEAKHRGEGSLGGGVHQSQI